MNLGTAQVIQANARSLPLADNSVDLVVTSPPYFALRSYQDGGEHYEGQIGSEPTPAEFVAALLEVTRECVRVLKPSGSLWVNLGDKYAASTTMQTKHGLGASSLSSGVYMPDQLTPTYTGRRLDNGPVRHKSLIGIPWRYALACIDDLGLILRAEVIWSKPNGLPESVTDRVRRSHEQWFHFTLEPRYFSAVDEIREATSPRKGEMSWAERKAAGEPARRGEQGANDATVNGMSANPLGKLPGSVWTVPTEPLRVPESLGIDHFAAFPTEWPRRIIQGWSPAGVCVECGEGRRPVAGHTQAWQDFRAANGMRDWHEGDERAEMGVNRGHSHGVSGAKIGAFGPKVEITGYACACGTFTSKNPGEDDVFPQCPHEVLRFTCGAGGCNCPCAPCAPYRPIPDTRPAVVLDPFGGTGTTAMVAKALGRHGITVDMSADYCRLAQWRTNDRDQLAKVLGIAKSATPVDNHQLDLFTEEQPA